MAMSLCRWPRCPICDRYCESDAPTCGDPVCVLAESRAEQQRRQFLREAVEFLEQLIQEVQIRTLDRPPDPEPT